MASSSSSSFIRSPRSLSSSARWISAKPLITLPRLVHGINGSEVSRTAGELAPSPSPIRDSTASPRQGGGHARLSGELLKPSPRLPCHRSSTGRLSWERQRLSSHESPLGGFPEHAASEMRSGRKEGVASTHLEVERKYDPGADTA